MKLIICDCYKKIELFWYLADAMTSGDDYISPSFFLIGTYKKALNCSNHGASIKWKFRADNSR